MNRRSAIASSGLLLLSWASRATHTNAGPKQASTQPLRGLALLEAAYDQRRVPAMFVGLSMSIKDGTREWARTASLSSREMGASRMELFRFHSPPELEGSSVLTREQTGQEPAQWVYVPAYHTVRRIAPASKGEPYLGTDYYYEDVLDPYWPDYRVVDLGDEKVEGSLLAKVESRPAAENLVKDSAYSRVVYYIEPVRRVIVSQEYYDRHDRLLKRSRNARLKQYGQWYLWDATEMENVQTGHKTLSTVHSRDVNANLPDDMFTVKALKRAR